MVGVLLGLGALNLAVYYWGARQRARDFRDLQRAIERQTIVLDVMNRLEDEKKFVDLLGSGVLGLEEGVAPSAMERQRFSASLDSIKAELAGLAEGDDPRMVVSIADLQKDTAELTRWWKAFYDNQGLDPTAAVVASASAEPIAESLLAIRLPGRVREEKLRLAEARDAFVRSDSTTSRMSWLIFAASAIVGATLSVVTLGDLFQSIERLKSGAHEIGQGRLDHRIEVEGGDELGEVARSFNQMAERLESQRAAIEEQKQVSEKLLLNILPASIAAELSERERVEAKYYADTTIVFADLVRFTRLFESLSVDRVVRLLDTLFTDFDRVVRAYRLEKLKTFGDAYIFAGGLAHEGSSHPIDAVMASFDIIEAVRRRSVAEELPLHVRIGIHTGPVAAGVVGIDKFAFDLWGETVNFAARLEAAGEPDRVNVSSGTHHRIKDFFACGHRGQIETKERRVHDMYFVEGLHPELAGPGCPPEPFSQRYRIYFEKAPGGFPQALVSA